MDKLIDELCNSIDPGNFRVENFPSLIFLCGGPTEKEDGTEGIASVRHYMCEYMQKEESELYEKVILAEKVNDWFYDSPYTHLLELEEDLAELIPVIPLFLEGEGSIAEFGFFVSVPHIMEKLLIFMEGKHYEQKTFIFLGPILKMIRNGKEDRIFRYTWEKKNKSIDLKKLKEIAPEICDEIKNVLQEQNQTEKFSDKKTAHKILLLCDFIDVAFIVRLQDVIRFFEKCEISVKEKDIKKYLAIAEKLNLLAKKDDGKDVFYFLPSIEKDDYISKYPQNSSKAGWKAKFREHIKKDKKRIRARKNWLEKNGGET